MSRYRLRFQSSPGLRAGCYSTVSPVCPAPPTRFNPHPAFGPGATGHPWVIDTGNGKFQSSPGLRAGCYPADGDGLLAVLTVSILTRPSGRVLRFAKRGVIPLWSSFNPHPAFGPGATAAIRGPPTGPLGFNPHPAFGPGATSNASVAHAGLISFNPHPAFGPGATSDVGRYGPLPQSVSILTRPSGRVLPGRWWWLRRNAPVSILTRPSGRVLRHTGERRALFLRFQSSPGLRAGCYHTAALAAADVIGFNPHPAFGPGATSFRMTAEERHAIVSILTRPSGRVLHLRHGLIRRAVMSFNPHPAFGPGATGSRLWYKQGVLLVSILTRPSGRVLPDQQGAHGYAGGVSILTRPSGRVLPPAAQG